MHLIVLMVGLEPTIPCGSRILSAMRIPFRHMRIILLRPDSNQVRQSRQINSPTKLGRGFHFRH